MNKDNANRNGKTLTIWQWNCRGFKQKQATLQYYIEAATDKPEILALQETNTTVKLTGYKTHQKGNGVCIMVCKECVSLEHDLEEDDIDYCFVEIIPVNKSSRSTFVLNIYSRPKNKEAKFDNIFRKARDKAGIAPLFLMGDFNAASPMWGYNYETPKGRRLANLITREGITILTDPSKPTRLGNSVSRDTCPDLSLSKEARRADWENS